MTKAPGEIEPPKQITKAEREARKAFRQLDAETAMSEYEIAQRAFAKNRERLKASGSHERPQRRRPRKQRPRIRRN